MRIHNLYADESGETHFRDIDIEMSEHGPDGSTSGRLPATGIYFRTTPADWFLIGTPPRRLCPQTADQAPDRARAERRGVTRPARDLALQEQQEAAAQMRPPFFAAPDILFMVM